MKKAKKELFKELETIKQEKTEEEENNKKVSESPDIKDSDMKPSN